MPNENLQGANLQGAILDGVDTLGTIFCKATMPHGSTDKSPCDFEVEGQQG